MSTAEVLPKEVPGGPLPLNWKPVDASALIHPPFSHEANGAIRLFLMERIMRFWTACVEDKKQDFVLGPLVILAESFVEKESKHYSLSGISDEHFDGVAWARACATLQREFPDIPPILWKTIASLGNRPNPTHETSIINVQDHLPYAWGICDAALHALGCSYGLFFHVQERLRRETGHILLHGCGCDHVVASLRETETGAFPLIENLSAKKFKVSREWLDHFLSQIYLIFVGGFPFRMNPEDFDSTKIVAIRKM